MERQPAELESLACRIYRRAHLTGEFRLRSGAVSDEYFDKYLFEGDPLLLREIGEALVAITAPPELTTSSTTAMRCAATSPPSTPATRCADSVRRSLRCCASSIVNPADRGSWSPRASSFARCSRWAICRKLSAAVAQCRMRSAAAGERGCSTRPSIAAPRLSARGHWRRAQLLARLTPVSFPIPHAELEFTASARLHIRTGATPLVELAIASPSATAENRRR